jgi:hypothetical protein
MMNNLTPGTLLLVKKSMEGFYQRDIPESTYHSLTGPRTMTITKGMNIKSPSTLFYLKTEKTEPELSWYHCLFSGKEIKIGPLPDKDIKKYITPVNLPDIDELASIDRWLSRYLKVRGNIFEVRRCNTKKVRAYCGRFKDADLGYFALRRNLLAVEVIPDYELVVGISVIRRAATRGFVFEFIWENKPFWIDFQERRGKKYESQALAARFHRLSTTNVAR